MRSRACLAFAEPQPSLAMHLQMHCKGTTFFADFQIFAEFWRQLAPNEQLQTGEYPTSTIYSALKRLQKDGYVIYSDRYEIEDPFFREWIMRSM